MDSLAKTTRQMPISDDWDDAYQRVESYLRAMQIRNRAVLNHLVQRVLERALIRAEKGEMRKPVEVASEELMRALADWFRSVLPVAENEDEASVLVRGRLALIMSQLTPARQALILSEGISDEAFLKELRRAYSLTGPNFEKATMRPRPLDLGTLPRAADRALRGLDRWPRLRMALLWTFLLSFFALIFYFTR